MNSTLGTIKKLVAALTFLSMAACNPFASDPTVSNTGYGKITVYTTYAGTSTKYIYSDYSYIGSMTAGWYQTSTPTCGTANQNSLITVTATTGSHYITANDSTYTWSGTVTVPDGGCVMLRLN